MVDTQHPRDRLLSEGANINALHFTLLHFCKSCILNRKYGYGKTKYGIKFHLLLMYHVIPRMRNANFVNKYGYFGTPKISMERFNIENSYLLGVFTITSVCHRMANYPL